MNSKYKYINKYKTYIIHSLNFGLVLLGVYFLTQVGVPYNGIGLFIRKSIVCILASFIVQAVVGHPLFLRKSIPSAIVFLSWLGYIGFKVMTFHMGADFRFYENELLIGGYGFLAFILLDHLYEISSYNRMIGCLSDVLKLFVLLPIAVELVHYFIYGYPIVFDEMMAVYNTNFQEAYEWFMQYMGIVPVLGISFLLLFAVYLLGGVRKAALSGDCGACSASLRKRIIAGFLFIATVYYPCIMLLETDCTGYFYDAYCYSQSLEKYAVNADEMSGRIAFYDAQMMSDKPHTVVVVIGESACRDKMSAYNPLYQYDNTPWLKQMKGNNDFVVLENAYSCQSLTQRVLENALTEMSMYNDKAVLESMNLIDVAKAKGYKTYWITDMVVEETLSAFFVTNAMRADVLMAEEKAYDEAMLECLGSINPEENNFIVFHGRGSHGKYRNRYPEDRRMFMDDNVDAEYSNAILYVDDFLKYIYEFGVDRLNMQMMLYFADHGENLQTGHGPSDHSFDKVRIPVFAYFGKDYQKVNKTRFERLKARQDWFYTNDMIYNTLCGLMNAESGFYDSGEDLSNENFKFKKEDLYTFDREVKVIDDPNLQNYK